MWNSIMLLSIEVFQIWRLHGAYKTLVIHIPVYTIIAVSVF